MHGPRRITLTLAALGLLVGGLLPLLPPRIVSAAAVTWFVSQGSGNDGNTCLSPANPCRTIGAAVGKAAAGDTISVANGGYQEALTIGKSLTIIGASTDTQVGTIVQPSCCLSAPTISVQAGVQLSLSTLALTNAGTAIDNAGWTVVDDVVFGSNLNAGAATFNGGNGGAIYNRPTGVVSVATAVFFANSANPASPASGGAIYNAGAFTLASSQLTNNQAGGNGGAIYNTGTLTVTGSTFGSAVNPDQNSNQAGWPTGGGDGGAIYNTGVLLVTGTTFVANVTGVPGNGGAIASTGTLTVTNSTFDGNAASNTGTGGAIYSTGSLSVNNVTFAGNYPNNIASSAAASPQVRLRNSILATGGRTVAACGGVLPSRGYNLSQDASCGLSGPGDLQNSDPRLGPLALNTGSTPTRALLPDSPAINAGHPGTPGSGAETCEPIDQRGVGRPQASRCDIGAFELVQQGGTPTPIVPELPPLALFGSGVLLLGAFACRARRR